MKNVLKKVPLKSPSLPFSPKINTYVNSLRIEIFSISNQFEEYNLLGDSNEQKNFLLSHFSLTFFRIEDVSYARSSPVVVRSLRIIDFQIQTLRISHPQYTKERRAFCLAICYNRSTYSKTSTYSSAYILRHNFSV